MAWSLQGAVGWVGESQVAKAQIRYGLEVGGAQHLFSKKIWYHHTGYLCTSPREAAAAPHSVLQLTCVKHFHILLGRFQDCREPGTTMATLPGETELSVLVDWG